MQQTVVVKATLGRQTGSRASRRLRAHGQLPGVVYGLGKEPKSISVDYVSLRTVLTGHAGMNAVFTLDVDGDQETVLVRDVQRDPIKRLVTHADFLRVDPDQKVRVNIPIELVGEAREVIDAGALIEQNMFEIEVACAPGRIPDSIEVDVSSMTLDSRIAVADLALPDGVETLVDDSISVVVPVVSRAAKVGAKDGEAEGELGEVEDSAEEAGDDDAAADEEE
jgi:large subunit ribosomal protein L25